jgi:hypothetical protein
LPGDVLSDGNYNAVLLQKGVRDRAGNSLSGANPGIDFFVLAGDANHGRAVDFSDLVVLAQNYNGPGGKTFDQGDFDYDGTVGFGDLVILAQRYNTVLAPATALPVAGATAEVPARSKAPSTAAVFSAALQIRPATVTRRRSKIRR